MRIRVYILLNWMKFMWSFFYWIDWKFVWCYSNEKNISQWAFWEGFKSTILAPLSIVIFPYRQLPILKRRVTILLNFRFKILQVITCRRIASLLFFHSTRYNTHCFMSHSLLSLQIFRLAIFFKLVFSAHFFSLMTNVIHTISQRYDCLFNCILRLI